MEVNGYFIADASNYLQSAIIDHLAKNRAGEERFYLRATLTDNAQRHPCITKVLNKTKPRLLRNYVQRSKTLFIDLLCNAEREIDVEHICTALRSRKEGAGVVKVVVLSSLRSWEGAGVVFSAQKETLSDEESQTDPKTSARWRSEDFPRRNRSEELRTLHELEDQLAELPSLCPGVEVFLFQTGLVYGDGEQALESYFESAWQQLPLKAPADDFPVRLIERKALAELIFRVLSASGDFAGEGPFRVFFAAEEKVLPLSRLLESISRQMGSGELGQEGKADAAFSFHGEFVLDPAITSAITELGSDFLKRLPLTCEEYCRARNLRPVRVLCVGESPVPRELLIPFCEEYKIYFINAEETVLQSESRGRKAGEEVQEGQMEKVGKRLEVLKARLHMNDCLQRGYLLFNAERFIAESGLEALLHTQLVPVRNEEEETESNPPLPVHESFHPDLFVAFGTGSVVEAILSYARKQKLPYAIFSATETGAARLLPLLRICVERDGRQANFLCSAEESNRRSWEELTSRQTAERERGATKNSLREQAETEAQHIVGQTRFAVLEQLIDADLAAEAADLRQYPTTRGYLTACFYSPVRRALEETRLCDPSDPFHFFSRRVLAAAFPGANPF